MFTIKVFSDCVPDQAHLVHAGPLLPAAPGDAAEDNLHHEGASHVGAVLVLLLHPLSTHTPLSSN